MSQTAVIYCRISMDREGAGLGVTRQERDCRALAERLGLDVVQIFTDNDKSAYSGKPRPGYAEMLEWIQAGRVAVVLAWHTDRLHRSPRELERYIDLTQDVPTYTVVGGPLDLSTPGGRLNARVAGAVARHESETKSRRVASAYEQRVLGGGFGGGRRRFGFAKDGLTVIPAEAAEIRAAAEAVLSGQSLASIVRDLNARGVLTPLGHEWTHVHLASMLRRPRNAGILILHGQEAGQAPWPPILPLHEWRQVCRILTDPARRSGTASNRVSALGSGLFCCGACGEGMDSRLRIAYSGRTGKIRSYRCPARGHVTITQAPLDEYVGKVITARLARPDAIGLFRTSSEPDLSGVHRERQAIAGRLDELVDLFDAGDITGSQLKRGTTDLRAKLAALDARVQAAVTRSPLAAVAGAEDVAARWAGLDLGRRRAILDALMTVTVGPALRRGAGFDPGRVTVDWRA